MILTPEQARRKTVAACQAALTKRGVAVLVVPADIANAAAHEERPYAVHVRQPIIRPSDADLDEIAAILNSSQNSSLRHAQNAAFIAGGIGRMTSKAGVAIATSGPGVSNLTSVSIMDRRFIAT
jgi:thiamine pyrophosphate-dependent acetolactate synthase large subunit-like protein